jgi:RHS repeat-associated protein
VRPRFVAVVLAVCSFASIASSQVTTLTDTTATPLPGAGHNYLGLLNETVSPENGMLSLRVSVPIPPGRHLTVPFSFDYDSNGAFFIESNWHSGLGWMWGNNVGMLASNGWSYAVPQLARVALQFTMPPSPPGPPSPDGSTTCGVMDGYIFTDAAGTRHSISLAHIYNNAPGYYGSLNWACGNSHFIESDSGGDQVFGGAFSNLLPPGGSNPDTNGPQDGNPELVSPDGSVYDFAFATHCSSMPVNSYTSLPTIEDRNGNKVSFGSSSCTSFLATDTLNRTVLSGSNFGVNGSTVSVAGLAQPYTLTWANKSYTGYTVNDEPTSSNPGSNCTISSFPLPTGSQSVVTALEMPNGQSYGFGYDGTYGTVNKITYPTGGYVSYVWGIDPLSTQVAFESVSGTAECGFFIDTAAVTERTVFDGSNTVEQQNFTYSTNWNATPEPTKQTTVVTHDLVRGTQFNTVYNYTAMPGPAGPNMSGSLIFVETSIQYLDVGGTLLKTVTKGWLDQFRLACEFQTIGTSTLSSGVFYTYGPGGQVTDKKEYDYGVVPASACTDFATPPATNPTRDTATVYQTFGNTPIFPSAPSIFDRPASVITSGIVSGTMTRMAETDYAYDGSAVSSATATNHDETSYAPSSAAPRGNATTVTRKCFQGTTTCPNQVTTSVYDETGQVTSVTDPKLNVTTYSYADVNASCGGNPPSGATDAYMTQVTYPPTSGVTHVENFCYGYDDGQLRSSSDENSQVTTYKYNSPANPPICSFSDGLDRLTETDYPGSSGGGKTYLCYNDTPSAPSVTTTKLLNSSQNVVSTTTMNGIGLAIQTQLTSDPQGTDTTVTAYDGLSRTYTVTNPYRSVSDTTYGVTTYNYDALGRTKTVTKPDSSTVTTLYCNAPTTSFPRSSTLVTDEALHWRRSQTDGLGRLVEVDEPNSTSAIGTACPGTSDPVWITSYTYDVLNDLGTVVQGGSHNRSFVYNSLKQLLTSSNPESNATGVLTQYTYDLNGNLATKIDARTLTTTYAYDALNRMTSRTYSNHDPTVSFTYDQAACLGAPSCYNIGHRTTMTDAGGSENLAYDQMGREIVELRAISTLSKYTVYGYDLAGDLITLAYPTGSGRTITYTYDSAGRPSEAQDVANGINYAQGLCANGLSSTGVCYTPFGSVDQMQQNGTGITSTYLYNTRLQPCWLYATTTASPLATTTLCTATDSTPGNILDLKYNFNLGAGDNGNVVGITNGRDTAHRNQSFTYDQVNRILTAQSSATSGMSSCWGESYTYDQWANMYAMTGLSGYSGCSQDSLSVSPTANNQLSATGYSYDLSGNMLADGANSYTYNTESEITIGAGVTYKYDGDGNRILKSSGKAYWYGAGTEILDESDTSGNITNEYVFFGGKRIAMRTVSTGTIDYYAEDMLGTSRAIVQAGQTTPCYDADFLPYGKEIPVTNTCSQNYKFEGKERDTETLNDDFGARYYSWRLGRWLSADWSAVPEPVPYANLANPQTLNLYTMVRDNPESFADLDGHYELNSSGCNRNVKCQKQWDKASDKFEKQHKKNLKSKKADVRTAAANFGEKGEANGVHVGFANLNSGASPSFGSVDATGSVGGMKLIQVTIDFGRAGSAETQTHEGTHVGDDQKFLDSYDPLTRGYNESLDPTHGQTEFNAFRAGAEIDNEHGFGPNDTQKILNFLHGNPVYGPIFDIPVFDHSNFPAGAP